MPLYDAFRTLSDLTNQVGISINKASDTFRSMATTTYDFSTMSDIVENRVIRTENSISDINICIRSNIKDLQEQIAHLQVEIDLLRSEMDVLTEKPKRKADLEIFDQIFDNSDFPFLESNIFSRD